MNYLAASWRGIKWSCYRSIIVVNPGASSEEFFRLKEQQQKMSNIFGSGLIGRIDVQLDSFEVVDEMGQIYWQYNRTDNRFYYSLATS